MGKVRGGLGEASLISDLTKPISFHISEALEAPPVFERRKKAHLEEAEKAEHELAKKMLEKAAIALDEKGKVEILFQLKDRSDMILIANSDDLNAQDWSVKSVNGEGGDYTEVPWQQSSFKGMNINEVIDDFAAVIKGVEVTSDETLLNFSSLDDFYEWLEF